MGGWRRRLPPPSCRLTKAECAEPLRPSLQPECLQGVAP